MYLALLAVATLAPPQQSELVQKYCAVCHTDAVRNGGLSLQHFNASHVDPSLAAMMLSKLHGGAMGAAGIARPDDATIEAFTATFMEQAQRAAEWTVTAEPPLLTATILREVSPGGVLGATPMYRLKVTCNSETHQGDIQVAWAPSPGTGTLNLAIDGKTPLSFAVQGREHMGNGSAITTGPAATTIPSAIIPLPAQSLTVSNLFPNQTVTFPFRALPQPARHSVAACFAPQL